MKRKNTILCASLSVLALLSSCNAEIVLHKTNSINFYDGESSLGTVTGVQGTKISDTDKTTITGYQNKEGYTFCGWYLNTELTNKTDVSYYPVADTSLYACFKLNVTITFDLNGGSYIDDNQPTVLTGLSGNSILGDFPKVKKDKSTFSNWTLDGEVFTSSTFPSQNIVLKANYTDWAEVSFNLAGTRLSSYTLNKFYVDPEKKVSEYIDFSDEIKAILSPSATANYKFKGWYTAKSKLFNFDSFITSSVVLTPMFKDKVIITFDVEGHTDVVAPQIGFNEDVTSAPTLDTIQTYIKNYMPSKHFSHWKTSTGEKYTFSTFPAESITLYAVFTDNVVYTIYTDSTKDETSKTTLNTYLEGQSIDLQTFKPTLLNKQYISYWVVEKVKGSATTKSNIGIDSTNKANYIVSADDEKFDSICFYPVIKDQYLLTINSAYLDESGNITQPVTPDSLLSKYYNGIVFSIDLSSSADYNGTNSVLYGFYSFNSTTSEYTKVDLPLELKEDTKLFAVKSAPVKLTINKIYVNEVGHDINKEISLIGYQGIDSTSIFKTIDTSNGHAELKISGINDSYSYETNITSIAKVLYTDPITNDQIDLKITSDGKLKTPFKDFTVDVRIISSEF